MVALKIAFGVLMLATAFCSFWMYALLWDEMVRGEYRSIWLYPHKLCEYVKGASRLRQVRAVRAAWLVSFIALLTVFACMLGINLSR